MRGYFWGGSRSKRCLAVLLLVSILLLGWFHWIAKPKAGPVPVRWTAGKAPSEASGTYAVNTHGEQPVVAGQEIRGTVWFDHDHRKAAPGVSVIAVNTRPPHNDASVITETDGTFILPIRFPEYAYTLVALDDATGRLSVDCPTFSIKKGQSVENIDLVIGEGGHVSGRAIAVAPDYSSSIIRQVSKFVRTKERPLSGLTVTLKAVGRLPFEVAAVTDVNGRYLFETLPAGPYEIVPERPEDAIVDNREISKIVQLESPGKMRADNVDFQFRTDGMSLAGNVADMHGQPLPDAEILVESMYEDASGPPTGIGTTRTVTDSAGCFKVSNLQVMSLESAQCYLPNGFAPKHVVRVRKDGYESVEVAVPALTEELIRTCDAIRDAENVLRLEGNPHLRPGSLPSVKGRLISGIDFVLGRGTSVSGILADRLGKCLAKKPIEIELTVAGTSGTAMTDPVKAGYGMTDELGRFSFERLSPGAYTFCTFGPNSPGGVVNRLDSDNEPLVLAAGDMVKDYIVTVEGDEERGEISGRVLDAALKTAISKFSVKPVAFNGKEMVGGRMMGHLDPPDPVDGAFVLRGVSPGLLRLRAEADSYAPAIQDIQVLPGKSTDAVLFMQKGGGIEGRVLENGMAASAAAVYIYNDSGESLQKATDKEGSFKATDLQPGEVLVVVQPNQPKNGQGIRYANARVSVESGRASRMDFNLEGTASLYGVFSFPSSRANGVIVVRERTTRNTPLSLDDWKILREQIIAMASLQAGGEYSMDLLPSGDYDVACACYNVDDSGKKIDMLEASYDAHLESGTAAQLDINLQ